MRTIASLVAASGILLASGPAHAAARTHDIEWRIGHDEGPFMEDGLEWSRPRRVPVVITEDGPLPSHIEVLGREKIELVVERSTLWNPNACGSGLVLSGRGLRAPVPDAQPIVITVFAYGGVDRLELACPSEGAGGALDGH